MLRTTRLSVSSAVIIMAHSGHVRALQRCSRLSRPLTSPKFKLGLGDFVLRSHFSQPLSAFKSLLSKEIMGTTSNRLKVTSDAERRIHSSICVTAGHSKWQNIKHIKAAQDRERGAKSNLLARKIVLALDKNPETDPKLNSELASLIKWARSNNIPNDVVDKTIDKQVKLRDPKSITSFDGRGPMNTGIMIECFSLKPHHTKGLLQGIVKKYGFNLNTPAADLFEHKGIIDAELSAEEVASAQADPEKFPLDKYIDLAIEAGAEDVTLQTGDEGPYLEFVCGPFETSKIQKSLSDSGLNVLNSERVYIPTVEVPVSDEYMEALGKLTDKLDLHPDVIKYHFNVRPES